MKTKSQIIAETAAFYNSKNRATQDGVCEYETEDGKNCAVGRCIDPTKINRKALCGAVSLINFLQGKTSRVILEDILLEEYKGHEVEFWANLQAFHDQGNYWNETGLSEAGESKLRALSRQYSRE